MSGDLNKAQFSVYALVMLSLLGILSALSITSVLRYSRWPIYTETNIVAQNEASFPAMTFCPLSKGYKESVLKVRK